VKLAADANVLLAAVLGGRAGLIVLSAEIEELLTAETTFAEVEEYVPVLARKKHLPIDILLLAVASLPVTVVGRDAYADSISEAKRRIGRRDPDDVDIPIWSNDRDFEDSGIQCYTTADLLRNLRMLEGK
jgi:predicted nucleic acid-binding protein